MTAQAENNKRIVKNTFLLYVRMLITMGIGFYTSRIVLQYLGVIDYGIYNVVGGIVASLSVLNQAMSAATQRFITFALGEGNLEHLKKVFKVSLTSQFLLSIIIVIIIESIGLWYLKNYAVIPTNRIDSATIVFHISTFTMFLSILNVPFLGTIMAHEKMGAYALFSISDVIMKLLICFVLIYTTHDKLILYSILLFITYLLNFSFIQIYSFKKFTEVTYKFDWDRSLFKQITRFASWTIFGNIAYVGYTQGITLLINLFFGPAVNAASGIASQATNILNQFSTNFQTALNPQITKDYAKKELYNMYLLIERSSKFSYFLMIILAIPLFCEADLLLRLWLGKVPQYSKTFMQIGLFISMFNAVRNPLSTAAMASGKLQQFQLYVNGLLLMVCPLIYLLYVFSFPPETSSIVFLIFLFLATLLSAYRLKFMIGLNYKSYVHNVIYKIFQVTILSFIIPLLICFLMEESYIRLIVITLTSVITSAMVIYNIGLNKNEQIFIREKSISLLKKYIHKR